MSDSVTVERVHADPSNIQSFISSWVNNVSRTSLDHVEMSSEGHGYQDVTLIWTS